MFESPRSLWQHFAVAIVAVLVIMSLSLVNANNENNQCMLSGQTRTEKPCSGRLYQLSELLNCFHTFHKTCLDKTGNKCPICVPRLSKNISSLCEAFNESIIKPTSRSTTPETTHPGSERDDEINDNIQINANIDPAYYESAQWETRVKTELTCSRLGSLRDTGTGMSQILLFTLMYR